MRSICETEGWDLGRYFRVDEKAALLRFEESWCATERSLEEFEERSREATFAPGVGLLGLAWESNKPLWSTDTAGGPSHRAARTLAQIRNAGRVHVSGRVPRQADRRHGLYQLPDPRAGRAAASGAARDRKPDRAVSRAPRAAKAHRPPQPVYAVLSGINATIVRVREREELLREACRIVVRAGDSAWHGSASWTQKRIG